MAIQRLILDVEMNDGKIYEGLKTTLADQMLYAKTSRAHKWAPVQEDSLTFLNFMAFAAMVRLGHFEGGFDAFCNAAGAVGDSGMEDVDPTTSKT